MRKPDSTARSLSIKAAIERSALANSELSRKYGMNYYEVSMIKENACSNSKAMRPRKRALRRHTSQNDEKISVLVRRISLLPRHILYPFLHQFLPNITEKKLRIAFEFYGVSKRPSLHRESGKRVFPHKETHSWLIQSHCITTDRGTLHLITGTNLTSGTLESYLTTQISNDQISTLLKQIHQKREHVSVFYLLIKGVTIKNIDRDGDCAPEYSTPIVELKNITEWDNPHSEFMENNKMPHIKRWDGKNLHALKTKLKAYTKLFNDFINKP